MRNQDEIGRSKVALGQSSGRSKTRYRLIIGNNNILQFLRISHLVREELMGYLCICI